MIYLLLCKQHKFAYPHTFYCVERMAIGIIGNPNQYTYCTHISKVPIAWKWHSRPFHWPVFTIDCMCLCIRFVFFSISLRGLALVAGVSACCFVPEWWWENAPEFSWYSKQNDCFREFGIIIKIMCAGMNAKCI